MSKLNKRVESLDKRIEVLESRVGDEVDNLVEEAEYQSRVLVSFILDVKTDISGSRTRPTPEQVEARMLERGICPEDARRFSRIGFDATQKELKASSPNFINNIRKS